VEVAASVVTTLTKFSAGLRLLGALNPVSLVEKTKIAQAIQSLKEILFLDSGVLNVLREIEEGAQLDVEILSHYRDYFQDISKEMQSILSYISPREFAGIERVSVSDIQSLDSIRHRKVNFRADISVFFDHCVNSENLRDDEALKKKAGAVVARVEKLNGDIAKLAKKLDHARKK
jgi:hypothetical protein